MLILKVARLRGGHSTPHCGGTEGYPINAYRQGGRMWRYVPEGIVGAFSGDKDFDLK
jgi:hypothetical protein